MPDLICANCGKSFYSTRSRKRYCSQKCASEAMQRVVPLHIYQLTCTNCGSEFESRYNTTKYCCDDCRREADRLRHRSYKADPKERQPFKNRKPPKPVPKKSTLIEIAVKARQNHTSYGKMMAMQMGLIPDRTEQQ